MCRSSCFKDTQFYFTLYSHLTGPFLPKCSSHRRSPQRNAQGKWLNNIERQSKVKKHRGSVFWPQKMYLPTKQDTTKGEMCRSSSPPRLYLSRYFPRTVSPWVASKMSQIPAAAVVSPRNCCPRLMRPCCPKRRLLLSSGRLGIEPSSQLCSGWQLWDEGGEDSVR